MTAASEKKGVIHLLQEFSIPLILGVVAALVYANLNYETYEHLIHLQVSNWVLFGHRCHKRGSKHPEYWFGVHHFSLPRYCWFR